MATAKKTTAKKTASKAPAKKAAPAKKTVATKAAPKKVTKTAAPKAEVRTKSSVSEQERMQMIATAAYFKAEKRGFLGGNPDQDWKEAEREVAELLAK